jgi:hypothetical protein
MGKGDLYTGYHTLAVEGLHEGKGTGHAPWNRTDFELSSPVRAMDTAGTFKS